MARLTDPKLKNIISEYFELLKSSNIPVSKLYLFGSYSKGTQTENSDIDLAIFWDRDNIDSFEADLQLIKLTKQIDLRIEPHSFSRSDLNNPDPFVKEILKIGEPIYS